MGEEGAEALSRLVKDTHMQELQLYMNDIGDGGAYKVRVGVYAQRPPLGRSSQGSIPCAGGMV